MISGYAIRLSGSALRSERITSEGQTSMRRVYLLYHLAGSLTWQQASWIGHRCVSLNDNPVTDDWGRLKTSWLNRDYDGGFEGPDRIKWLSKLMRTNELLSVRLLLVNVIQMYLFGTRGSRLLSQNALELCDNSKNMRNPGNMVSWHKIFWRNFFAAPKTFCQHLDRLPRWVHGLLFSFKKQNMSQQRVEACQLLLQMPSDTCITFTRPPLDTISFLYLNNPNHKQWKQWLM